MRFALLLWLGVALAAPESPLPRGVQLPQGVDVPNSTALAIYIPARELESSFYVESMRLWAEPGKALDDARREVGHRLFQQVLPVDGRFAGAYGLLLAVHPKWSTEAGSLRLDMRYRVYGAAGQLLLEGSLSQSVGLNSAGPLGGFPNAAIRAMQAVLIELLQNLAPSATKYPPTGDLALTSRELLIDRSAPVTGGTGVYVNAAGQILTAAHALRGCMVIEAGTDAQATRVILQASSDLLDLAVVESGRPTGHAMPLRVGQVITPGEAIIHVEFPSDGVPAAPPDLTRGTVSGKSGFRGGLGMLRFLAPGEPGSSGGPLVSAGGELLGLTVGTLDFTTLVEQGLLAEDVNFALDARYVAKFLRDAGVEFAEVEPRPAGDAQVVGAAALRAVVRLNCYQ